MFINRMNVYAYIYIYIIYIYIYIYIYILNLFYNLMSDWSLV